MAKVRAIQQGFDGLALRNPGDEFEFDGAPGSWFEYVNPADKKEAEEKHHRMEVEAKYRAEMEANVRAEMEAKAYAEREERLKAELEQKVRAELGAAPATNTATEPV